ncbi:MAG: hypothetical protein KatS3mg038_3494 [Candidatus Kapaibacterium sp.]|nr:MAG: hypothetical protein KatS3mg038_0346 [Candidatus Kapabacteria bacterium]GIV49885.1 MAG: hypothetical protein KatS3mg038_0406 [Candidatus Kapabacteria bacterium]GIV50272.1 MAG: hypothetical protein KatS3mg038_0793 [Candidatus Kapabacteria bacterium]GIV50328.1 MAG: hypothetical protein KatS3mg038_0849 [Candidatus Kapabacteria bacterium]GIV50770.1 MAG: hypothetical protein KatS3mg038_1291 [Candidatus Kapabacteria bacterium]
MWWYEVQYYFATGTAIDEIIVVPCLLVDI